jgi:hypothetical protein
VHAGDCAHGERVWAVSWSCSRIVTIADLDRRRATRKVMEAKAPGSVPSHSTRERWVVKTLRKPAPRWQNRGHGGESGRKRKADLQTPGGRRRSGPNKPCSLTRTGGNGPSVLMTSWKQDRIGRREGASEAGHRLRTRSITPRRSASSRGLLFLGRAVNDTAEVGGAPSSPRPPETESLKSGEVTAQ